MSDRLVIIDVQKGFFIPCDGRCPFKPQNIAVPAAF